MNQHRDATSNREKEDIWALSADKLFTHFIAFKTHVQPPYQMMPPAKLRALLPPATVPVILHYRNKKWKMHYQDHYFDLGWKSFVVDNNIKVGDGCVFELIGSSSKAMKFRVQILDGKIPSQLLARSESGTADNPITLD